MKRPRAVAVSFVEVPGKYGLLVLATAPNVVRRAVFGRRVELASSSSGALVVHIEGEGFFRLAEEEILVEMLLAGLCSKPDTPPDRRTESGC